MTERPTTVQEYLEPAGRLRLIGHRGLSARFPENTLASFEAALAAGADMLELDVARSADGVPVVLHDATLDRTTDGRGLVAAKDLASLKALDAGQWFGPSFAGERIPTLAEVFALVGERAPINVELKSEAGVELVAPVIDEIQRAEASARVVLSCFDPSRLRVARDLAPEIARSSLLSRRHHRGMAPGEIMDDVASLQLSPSQREVTPAMVAACRGAKRRVAVYTVNDPDEARALHAMGVHAVFTDDVGALGEALGRS